MHDSDLPQNGIKHFVVNRFECPVVVGFGEVVHVLIGVVEGEGGDLEAQGDAPGKLMDTVEVRFEDGAG